MKNLAGLLLFSLLMLVPAAESSAQWKKITTIPPPYNTGFWLDVHFLKSNPDFGWVCGYDGYVIRTTDGGTSWRGVQVNPNMQLESIHFVNDRVGYTSGGDEATNYGRIFRTTDGGASWKEVTPSATVRIWGCYFVDENYGMAVGGGCGQEQQSFLRTTNGGANWTILTKNQNNTSMSDVMLYSRDGLGYASSSGYIWRTTDGGRSWNVFSNTGGTDWQEEITNINQSFLVPYSGGCSGNFNSGGMRFSTDNGDSWTDFASGKAMFGSYLVSEQEGWVCGFGAGVFHTEDGGLSWRQENCGISTNASLDDIYFISDTLGWVVGQDGVYKSDFGRQPYLETRPQIAYRYCGEAEETTLSIEGQFDQYFWSNGAASPMIRTSKPGVYSVRAVRQCDSSFVQNFVINVAPRPVVTIESDGPLEFCEGDSITLRGPEGNYSYLWSTGSTGREISVKSAGVYSLTISDSIGCTDSGSITVRVIPLPAPSISASTKTTFCVGDSVRLEAGPGFTRYEWRNVFVSDEVIGTGSSIVATVSGIYTVVVENAGGCRNISDSMLVTVKSDTNQLEFLVNGSPVEVIESTTIGTMNCRKLLVRNAGSRDFLLTNAVLMRNLEFSFPQSQFPVLLAPNESIELNVCFAPVSLGEKRDTILFIDNCSPHFIPLRSEGMSREYDADTRCDVPVQFSSFAIGTGVSSVSFPFPQPAEGFIILQVRKFSPTGNNGFREAALYSSQGVLIRSVAASMKSMERREQGYFANGEYRFDTSDLGSGTYFLRYEDENTMKVFPVMVNGTRR